MAFQVGELFLALTASDVSLTSGVEKAGSAVHEVAEKLETLQERMGNALKAVYPHIDEFYERLEGRARIARWVAGISGGIMVGWLAAFVHGEGTVTQFDAAMAKMGRQAGVTAEEMDRLNESLYGKSTAGEVDLKGIETILLRSTQIKGVILKDAVPAILDMSAALKKDLTSSAREVAKALSDPEHALTTLGRAGIVLSEEQRALIKALFQTGQAAEAQRIILDQLNKQFGGAAAAKAGTLAGQLTIISTTLEDLGAEFGKILAGMIMPLVKWIGGLVAGFRGLSEGVKKAVVILVALGGVGGAIIATLPLLVSGFSLFAGLIASVGAPVWLIVAAVGALIAILIQCMGTGDTFAEKLANAFKWVAELIGTVITLAVNYDLTWESMQLGFNKAITHVKERLDAFFVNLIHQMEFYGEKLMDPSKWFNGDAAPAWADAVLTDFSKQEAALQRKWDERLKGKKAANEDKLIDDPMRQKITNEVGMKVKVELVDAAGLFKKNLLGAFEDKDKSAKETAKNTKARIEQAAKQHAEEMAVLKNVGTVGA